MNPSPSFKQPLRATLRLVVGGGLELLMLFVGSLPVWDYGVYDKTKFWNSASNFIQEFAAVFLPTIVILFLLPVIIRGSRPQKILAIVFSLLPAWLAITGWIEIISRFGAFVGAFDLMPI
jgi:hypothetical protein